MKNIWKTLFINKIYILGFIFLFTSTMSFADKGDLSKAHVDSLKKREKKLWYVDKFKSEKKPILQEEEEIREPSNIGKIIDGIIQFSVWIIIALAIIGAGYLILKNLKGYKFKTNSKVQISTKGISEEELVIKNLNTADLSSLIEKSIQDKNYRLAVRYYYLWVIKLLNESQLIEFNIDKTNQDYTHELSRKNTLSKEKLNLFIQCTHYYEYLWFGQFAVTELSFLKIEKTFKDFLTKKA